MISTAAIDRGGDLVVDRIMTATDQRWAVFETAIGWCGLVWSPRGVVGVELPHAKVEATRTRLASRYPTAVETRPDQAMQAVIDAIIALIAGETRDLKFVELDLADASPFNLSVYAIARAIPSGWTRTYGEIALELGDRQASRAVGRALGDNPWPIIVPCHRVLAAGGGIGGFSGSGGVATKARLLAIEKARTGATPGLFDEAATFSLAPKRP